MDGCRAAECRRLLCRWPCAALPRQTDRALPRRYVARERLCLRGTTDYWLNALDGRPFFVVSRPADPGLLSVLREDIVPRLLADAAGQPSQEALAAAPLRSRFTLVFDREGYSPGFFLEM